MGNYLEKPSLTKENACGTFGNITYALSAMQGWKQDMMDRHYISTDFKEYTDWISFGLFHGHGETETHTYCSKNLVKSITRQTAFKENRIEDAIRAGTYEIDRVMPVLLENKKGGTTSISVYISNTKIYYSNVGNSRAIMCRNGEPHFVTVDHDTKSAAERSRVWSAGGTVLLGRVNGIFTMTRTLGDFELKLNPNLPRDRQIMSAEPEIYVRDRCDADEFLVIATEDVWKIMTNEEICQFITNRMMIVENLTQIANDVLETCFYKGSKDCMTIVIVKFPRAPKLNRLAIKKDSRFEKRIGTFLRDEMQYRRIYDFDVLMQRVQQCSAIMSSLPPGGIHSKYNIIQRIFKENNPHKPCEFFEYYQM